MILITRDNLVSLPDIIFFFRCKNCGATDHRHWECQEQKNITSTITCNKCGGYGHVAADCQVKT